METLFECRTVHNKQWAKDLYGYMYFRRPIILACHILLTLEFLLGVGNWIARGEAIWTLLILPPLLIGFFGFTCFYSINLTMKRHREMYGEEAPESITTVTDETLVQKASNGGELTLHYADIKKLVRTNKYFYLWSSTKVIYTLARDGFTVGSPDGFLALVKQKGIRVK